jgi:FAD/FMN-containing dehydrogenase/Fe-S oxidoreductase
MTLPKDFLFDLSKRFTGDLRLDSAAKVLYSTDASMYQIEPLGVGIPKTQDDLQAAVEFAAKYTIPILPRGSGTSLAGQAIGKALILDCSRYLNSIIEINPEEHYAIVEPGVILADLNRAAAKHGLMFGPDPASAERATMGGVIGNNATGAHSILYGMSADHLLEADVILSDGSSSKWGMGNGRLGMGSRGSGIGNRESEIISIVSEIREKYSESIKQNYPKSWRNSAGYRLNYLLPWSPSKPPQWDAGDYGLQSTVYRSSSEINLAPLLAGSEGTLAVIRKLKVNLVHKPKHTILGVLQYQSVAEACDDVPRLLEFNPSAIELIPRMILQLARSVPAVARESGWIVGDPAGVLVIEFSGDEANLLREKIGGLDEVSTSNKLLTIAESNEDQSRVWNIRKMGLGILDSRKQNARPVAFIEDCAVPVQNLGEFVREIEKILSAHNVEGGIYAHASGGCLHIRPMLNLKTDAGRKSLRSIAEQVLALTLKLGGSMSSEHGDGLARGEFIEKTYGKEITDAMRILKHAADPHNILNPKKLFDAPLMDSNLRSYPHPSPLPSASLGEGIWNSALQFEHEDGLVGAIEMCNGQGVCRKSHGVMCPSFQASGDEALSTRGRANLLRAAISSQQSAISKAGLIESTFQTLDLCLACKGCTSECPSGVDMPRLKYEFMNQYYKSHRRPLHDYLFAYFHVVAKWLAPIAALANWLMKMKPSSKLIAKTFGLSEKRPLPLFRKSKPQRAQSFLRKEQEKKVVLFLSDVFSEYLEPEVKEAAIDVLNHLGYEVKMLSSIGAGASFLSKGFIHQAKRHANQVLDEIKSLGAGVVINIVGCEPPEVYCLKHEYLALLPHRKAEIQAVTKNVWLVDEFILRVAKLEPSLFKSRNLTLNNEKRKIFFHPHCHQRAEGLASDGLPSGAPATVEMLKLFGFDVELSDAGCCGMAGTFGFDAEHYELSMQVFKRLENRILENSQLSIASTGSACRMQIRDGAGVEAKHPLMMVRDVLLGNL